MRESTCCHILAVLRFMIDISAATPVWLLVDFLPLLGVVVDQLKRLAYWMTSTNLSLISYNGVTMIPSSSLTWT